MFDGVVSHEPARPLAGWGAGVTRIDQRVCNRPELMAERSWLRLHRALVVAAPALHGRRHELHAAGKSVKRLLDVGQRDGKARYCVRAARPLLKLTGGTTEPAGAGRHVRRSGDVGIHALIVTRNSPAQHGPATSSAARHVPITTIGTIGNGEAH